MTDEAVNKLFDTIGPRFGDRNGGYTRIVRTAWQKGDGADKAFIELLGSEQLLDEKRQKRAEARAKKAEETRKAMEEQEHNLPAKRPPRLIFGRNQRRQRITQGSARFMWVGHSCPTLLFDNGPRKPITGRHLTSGFSHTQHVFRTPCKRTLGSSDYVLNARNRF